MCFGLVLKGSHKVMYLMASRQEMRDMWIRGLRYAVQMDHLAEQRNEMDKYPSLAHLGRGRGRGG